MAQQGDDDKTKDLVTFKPQWGKLCGGSGGGSFQPNTVVDGRKFRIDAIRLSGGKHSKHKHDGLYSIQVRVNGKWQSKHGEGGAEEVTLELAENEYISSVNIRSGDYIDHLTFFTNFSNSISCGGNGGSSYSEPGSNEAMLLGLNGRSGWYIDQLQFKWGPAVQVPYNPTWGQVFGGGGGGAIGAMKTDGKQSKITGVRLWSRKKDSKHKYVGSIQFQVNGNWRNKYGEGNDEGQTLILADDEYFQHVEIQSGWYIDNLKLSTNKLRSIQAGGSGGGKQQEGGSKRLIDCRGRGGWYIDQLQFMWMDEAAYTYKIISCMFDVDQGQILSKTPEVIAQMPITNDSDTEQQTAFNYNQTVSNSSSFNRQHGFTVKVGTTFETGIPVISEGKVTTEVSTTHTWTFGKTNTTTQSWNGTFTVKCPAHKSIIAQAIVTKSKMDVPYTITVENGMGDKQTSRGIWKGVSTYNLALNVRQIN